MQISKSKKVLFVFSFALVSLFIFNGMQGYISPMFVYKVDAKSSTIDPIENLAVSDLGAKLKFSFNNVTYTTDGTGTDVLTLRARPGNSAGSPFLKTQAVEPQNVKFTGRFDLTVISGQDPVTTGSSVVSTNYRGKILTTNETLSGETFHFDTENVVDLGKFDFSSNIGSKTVENITAAESATASQKIDAQYAHLNKTLVEIPTDYQLSDGNFAGSESTKLSGAKYTTIVVGYEDFESGAIEDLRSYLSGQTGIKKSLINIQHYDVASVGIMYNYSTKMINFLRDALDYADNQASTTALMKQQPVMNWDGRMFYPLGFDSVNSIQFLDDIVSSLNNFVQTASTQIGSTLDDFQAKAVAFWNDPVGTTVNKISEDADKVWNTFGNFFKGAASDVGGWFQNITSDIGAGVDNFIQQPLGSIGTFFSGIVQSILPIVAIGLLIIGLIIVAFVLLRKSELI